MLSLTLTAYALRIGWREASERRVFRMTEAVLAAGFAAVASGLITGRWGVASAEIGVLTGAGAVSIPCGVGCRCQPARPQSGLAWLRRGVQILVARMAYTAAGRVDLCAAPRKRRSISAVSTAACPHMPHIWAARGSNGSSFVPVRTRDGPLRLRVVGGRAPRCGSLEYIWFENDGARNARYTPGITTGDLDDAPALSYRAIAGQEAG